MNATVKRNVDPGFNRTILGPGRPKPSQPVKDPGFSRSLFPTTHPQPDSSSVGGHDKDGVDPGFGRSPWLYPGCDVKPPTKGGVEVDPQFSRSICDHFIPSDEALQLLGGGEKSKVRTIFESLGF